MGNLLSSRSELHEDENCVGAYSYNPCWVCAPLNNILCCGLPVWREGGGHEYCPCAVLVLRDDGIKFHDPAWDKASSLRSDFEDALQGETKLSWRAPKTALAAFHDPNWRQL